MTHRYVGKICISAQARFWKEWICSYIGGALAIHRNDPRSGLYKENSKWTGPSSDYPFAYYVKEQYCVSISEDFSSGV